MEMVDNVTDDGIPPAAGDITTEAVERSFDQPMSVWRYIRDSCDWTPNAKLAYWSLYSRRGRDGSPPYPGQRRIAKDMGASRNAAADAIKTLQEMGAVRVVPRKVAESDEQDTSLYVLTPPWDVQAESRRKPRGMHVAPKQPQVALEQNHVDLKQSNVALEQGDSGSKTEQQVALKQSQNENREQANEQGKRKDSSPPKAVRPRRSDSAEEKPKVTPESQEIVAKFDELMRQHTGAGVEDWGQARKTVDNVCKGSGGAQSIPKEEAIDTLVWAMPDPYHRKRFVEIGLRYLRSAWAAWKERNSPRRSPAAGRQQSNVFLKGDKKDDTYYDHVFKKFD